MSEIPAMQNICRQCNTPIPPDSPNGICPACLLSIAKVTTGPEADPRLSALSVGELAGRIPGIEFRSLLGQGGMGAVYRGHQTDLNREVAVKILPQAMSDDPIFIRRFRREAEALAKLDHPNIVTVYGSGISDGLCYIVMEFVEGTTLREAMAASAVDPAAALRIVPQICDALAYAHKNGVVHRDIKPENILLGVGGKVKVVDFGLAKMSDDERAQTMLTATGTRLGTLRYMAPEQLDGTTVDHRADVYSLGVVFYEMLTGQVPMGQFAMPSEKSGVDPRIDEVVMRTLSREPADRYQRVGDIEQELQSISDGGVDYGWDASGRRSHRGWHRPIGHRAYDLWQPPSREWKSKSTIFGYPIVHLAYGYHPTTGQKLVARGLIAIGDIAIGGLAMGGLSIGAVSFGGLALGLNAFGGMAIGLQLAGGGAAIGGLAMGGGALGAIAIGGGAIGLLALGGGGIGKIAIGAGCKGTYTLDHRGWNPPEFADSVIASMLADQRFAFVGALIVFLMMIGPILLVAAIAVIGKARSAARGTTESKMPPGARNQLWGSLWGVLVVPLILPVMFAMLAGQASRQVRRAAEMQNPAAETPVEQINTRDDG